MVRDPGETAREAALRTVLSQTSSPRNVDIFTPAGVVLHVRAEPGGRLHVLGQSTADPACGGDETATATGDPTRVTTDEPATDPSTGRQSATGAGTTDATPASPTAAEQTPSNATDDPSATQEPATSTSTTSSTSTSPPRVGGPWTQRDLPWPAEAPPPSPEDEAFEARMRSPRRRLGRRLKILRRPDLQHGFRRPRANRGRILAVVAVTIAALVTVSALAGGLIHLARSAQAPAVHIAQGEPFPGDPPDGTGEPRWASPVLHRESPVALVPGEEQVLSFVTADRTLAAVDPATGAVRWTTSLPEGALTTGPATTRVDGAPAIAARVGDHVLLWAAADGRTLADVTVPAGSELVLDGQTPMIRIDAGRAALLDASGLHDVDLPDGARALAGREDGTILAGNGQGWWHLRPSTSSEPAGSSTPAGPVTPWEQMRGLGDQGTPEVVAAIGSFVLLVHPDPDRPRLLVHHDGDVVRASFQSEYTAGRDPIWAPSPSRSWGILGRSLVDAESGQVTDLGDWRTVLVAEDHAYGLVGDTLHTTGPGRPITPVSVSTAVVEAGSAAASVVRADTPEGPRVWVMSTSAYR